MTLRRGQEIDVEIERVAVEGRGVGRLDGLVVFVEKALPGELVRARVSKVKRNFAQARAVDILRPTSARVDGRCTHLGACGGCTWQELQYEAQLAAKQHIVREALERLGGFRDIEIPETVPSPERFFYRNKMEFSFFAGRDDEIVLGLHSPGTFDRVFDLDACFLMSEQSNRIVSAVRVLAGRSGRPAYHTRRHVGFWRYLVVREGKNTGQIMVNLVTNEGALPNQHQIVREIREVVDPLTCLVRTVNAKRANVAFGEREEVLHGGNSIDEVLDGLRFRISPSSFFQPNPRQAEVLFKTLVDWAGLRGGESVVDLYAGTGVISLFLARVAARVIGIELVEDAVRDAERNARLNHFDNCTFRAGEVRGWFRKHAAEVRSAALVVADPPRSGMHPDVVRALSLLQPARILYVSCNPSSLARDAQMLREQGGYHLTRVQPFDMFPHTYHVETLALLERTPNRT
jgi:23S rRNA (uracil1939-C5)-methyltransferase